MVLKTSSIFNLHLPPSRCHPKNAFKAIQSFWVSHKVEEKFSSEETFLAERIAEYKGYLVNLGYPSKLLLK